MFNVFKLIYKLRPRVWLKLNLFLGRHAAMFCWPFLLQSLHLKLNESFCGPILFSAFDVSGLMCFHVQLNFQWNNIRKEWICNRVAITENYFHTLYIFSNRPNKLRVLIVSKRTRISSSVECDFNSFIFFSAVALKID